MEHSPAASQATTIHTRQRHSPITLWLLVASLPMLVLLLFPILALLLRINLSEIGANLANEEVRQAIWLSLSSTTVSTLLGLLLGTPLAYLLARRSFRGRGVLDTLVDLPMVLPPSVAGIALLLAFGRRGVIGQWLDEVGLSIAFTTLAVILAQTFVATPFYIKTAIAAFASLDRELEQAAAVDGASPWQVFVRITVPICWPILLGGLVMSWARALGEFGATIIFAGNFPGRTQTMPLAIYIGFELDLGMALTLSIILLTISYLLLFLVKRILQQGVTVPR